MTKPGSKSTLPTSTMKPNSSSGLDKRVRLGWGLALFALVLFTFWRVGGFDLTTKLSSGRTVPNMFATVDHPFHASRGAVLLDSLRDGEILRWMGSHQGGYPVEFYPLGVAWLDVGIWAAFLGTIPILAVHKITVALILVLPAVAYWLLVRGDKLHPSIAFLAMAFHIAIPGYWLNGGYEELVGWGLVTNVAGASFAVISTILLARYVLNREHWCGIGAVLAISAGAVSNPRSLFGVVIATLAIAGWALFTNDQLPVRRRLIDICISIGIVGVLSLALAAPVISSLLRYSEEYFFLHYQFYDPLSMYWDALKMALSWRILALAIIGMALVFALRRSSWPRVSQVIAITVATYSLFTMWVATTENPPPLVEQLEAPRLMPFQRFLMIALAAVAVELAVQWFAYRLSVIWREVVIAIVVLAVSAYSIGTMINRPDGVPVNENALYVLEETGNQQFADFEDAVRAGNDVRLNGSSIFVVGNQDPQWHEQLWAPGIENGTYYYDDWLWYWHSDQPGPYDPMTGYYMPNPSDALVQDYFDQHGIGVVLVHDMWVPSGPTPRQTARQSDLLDPVGSFGGWDVYAVKQPGAVATRGQTLPDEIQVDNQEIRATFPDGSGDILIRQNWFPRWSAEVNGEPARIERDESGYMRIAVPDGSAELVVTYGVTVTDWVSRAASVAGGIGLIAFAWRGGTWRPKPEEVHQDVTTRPAVSAE